MDPKTSGGVNLACEPSSPQDPMPPLSKREPSPHDMSPPPSVREPATSPVLDELGVRGR
jgi:hypothetical protein